MRWHFVSGLNGYMSCESIQTSWFQVWFIFNEALLMWRNLSYSWESEQAMILAMFEWSKLIGLS